MSCMPTIKAGERALAGAVLVDGDILSPPTQQMVGPSKVDCNTTSGGLHVRPAGTNAPLVDMGSANWITIMDALGSAVLVSGELYGLCENELLAACTVSVRVGGEGPKRSKSE